MQKLVLIVSCGLVLCFPYNCWPVEIADASCFLKVFFYTRRLGIVHSRIMFLPRLSRFFNLSV